MGANRRFSRDSHTCTTWSPTSVAPSTLANVVWKSKEGKSRHATGCSISKSSRLEAFDERYHTPPLNRVECENFHIKVCRRQMSIKVPPAMSADADSINSRMIQRAELPEPRNHVCEIFS